MEECDHSAVCMGISTKFVHESGGSAKLLRDGEWRRVGGGREGRGGVGGELSIEYRNMAELELLCVCVVWRCRQH